MNTNRTVGITAPAHQRIVALHFVLLGLVALTLVSCGSTTPAEQIVGTWKFTERTSQGETRSGDDLGFEAVYQFFEDGSMVSTMHYFESNR